MPSWFNDLMSSDQMRVLARCPVCHIQNDFKEVRVIREKSPEVLLMHHCPQCQSNVIFCVANEPWGVGSVGLVTDLDVDEIERYLTAEQPLNENSILDYYKLLQHNKSNILVRQILTEA